MEEKAEKPSGGERTKNKGNKWHCPICGARLWLNNKKRHTQTKQRNDANYVLREKFEIN